MTPRKKQARLIIACKFLPLQASMKKIPAVHLILDKSGNMEASLHSSFCTLTCSHQNSPLKI